MGLNTLFAGLLVLSLPTGPAPALDTDPSALLSKQIVRIDPFHSVLSFSVTHFGFTRVRGRFGKWGGYILWDKDDITRSSMTIVIDVRTVDTGMERRDNDLMSDQFFDAEQYPTVVFRSTRIEPDGDGFIIYGDLAIRDVTREVGIPFNFLGTREFATGFGRIFGSGSLTISREEFGLTNATDRIARSLAVVSDDVDLEIEIQGAAVDMAQLAFGSQQKPSIGELLAEVVSEEGADAAVERFYALRENEPDGYNFNLVEVVKLSHRLRAEGRADEAVTIGLLALEMDDKPSRDAHATLVLAYVAEGDIGEAIAHCQAMLALDAQDALAMEMLRYLENG